MDNQDNNNNRHAELGSASQETLKQVQGDKINKDDNNTNKNRVGYLVIIIAILAVVSFFVYNNTKDKIPSVSEEPTNGGVLVGSAELSQYFQNQEKKLMPDVLPPDEIKQRFEDDLVLARQYIIDEEAKEDGNEYQGYMGVANTLRALGKYEEAEQAYLDMIERFPEDELTFHNLGVLYEDMRQYLDAARAYSTSIVKKPEELIAHTKLADLYIKNSSEPSKAKEVYLKALEATNNHPEMLKAFASYLENVEKNLPQALLYWQEVLKAYPDNQAVKERVEELEKKIN
jgi:tetratricopeptide (TPR) repeat protein